MFACGTPCNCSEQVRIGHAFGRQDDKPGGRPEVERALELSHHGIPKGGEKSAKRGKPVEDKMAPQGPFWKGLVFSGVGAAIGAVVWIGIAYATGYWGMLPVLLVGLLAGLGMQRGQEGYSYLGGFAAAGITLVVMFLAGLPLRWSSRR